jgi:hypothetical protein
LATSHDAALIASIAIPEPFIGNCHIAQMNKLFALSAASLLAACATLPAEATSDGVTFAHFGQTVTVGGPRVTPIRLIEDSRCPIEARCIQAGEVRILARLRSGRGSATRELTLGKSIAVADGELELASVMPPRSVQRQIRMRDYRFGFRFAGGL